MILIFSGYNQRAVIAFLRTLKNNKISSYGIIASSGADTILKTEYASKVIYIRKNKQLSLKEICMVIDAQRRTKNIDNFFIVPSTEALNRFLLEYRQVLEKYECIIPLVEKKLYESISDKETFCEVCKEYDLCVPELTKFGVKYKNPIVAKPKKYFASDGKVYSPIIIKNEKDFKEFRDICNQSDFMYQEYINGESYYLLYYFTRDGKAYRFSQKNYMQQNGGKSILAAVSDDLHLRSNIVDKYEKMFLKIGFYGFVMVEVREQKDKYTMIEANPRFWGPSQLFCDAGYNLFEFFLQEYGFLQEISLKTVNYQEKYFWSGGLTNSSFEEEYMWFGNGKEVVEKNIAAYFEKDIYKRQDTIDLYYAERKGQNEGLF